MLTLSALDLCGAAPRVQHLFRLSASYFPISRLHCFIYLSVMPLRLFCLVQD